MSPSVVWIVAESARGDGPLPATGAAVATFCSSRVGRSLKTSRSPDLVSLQKWKEGFNIFDNVGRSNRVLRFRSGEHVESLALVSRAE